MIEKIVGRGLANISVIMPAYNAANTIERALSSVIAQTLNPREVIVIDDGSIDETFNRANNYKEKMGEIELKVFRQINSGAGSSRNKAISESRFEIIAFLDSDDEWLPEKLEKSIDYMNTGPHVLVAHNGWIVKNKAEFYLDIASRFKAAKNKKFQGLYKRGFISTSSVVVLRNAVNKAGGFDTNLRSGQDFDLWLKILGNFDVSWLVFEEPLSRYYVMEKSITSYTQRRLQNTLTIAIRHAPILNDHPGSAICSFWFRLTVIHGEAIKAYISRQQYIEVIQTIAMFLLRIPGLTLLHGKMILGPNK